MAIIIIKQKILAPFPGLSSPYQYSQVMTLTCFLRHKVLFLIKHFADNTQ
ncbi:hypothetical protein PNIG_p0074 (plasmid) [Pseudoalteromonas nigrifaciens]|uniref:Uncharacterized protein n=1 Tax=Pseudoalteromonas nigrifaciens TaxID=28109 RepID=A0AAC9UMS1_9GAMM|nr:hypothetical protein PNIG_p0074 [Pseudoalteromonas nigrifaciens]